MTAKIFSLDEVSKHKTKSDLWVVIHNKVYDITRFVVEHPGGEEVLVDEGGKDATEAFEDIGHSDEAREMLEEYLIGSLDEASRTKEYNVNVIRAGELPEEKKGSSLRIILPALAIIGALVYKYVIVPKAHQ
uniref:Cytochrome b5 n=1 Tax=Rhizopus stolonifer TaxID=4846 RepID=CYB5_RHIST|nr:RecName: Full=Cytochrome b5 [Rhizopus stolonifer]AAG23835.1 cytochrome b5 [Rhizopus stolonifer]